MAPLTAGIERPRLASTLLPKLPARRRQDVADATLTLLQLAKAGKSIVVPAISTRSYTLASGNKLTIETFAIDFEDPAGCAELRLLQLQAAGQAGCRYLNPEFTVTASANCGEFCQGMQSCEWFKSLHRACNFKGRKSGFNHLSEREKALGFTGVLVKDDGQPTPAGPLLHLLARIERRERRQQAREGVG